MAGELFHPGHVSLLRAAPTTATTSSSACSPTRARRRTSRLVAAYDMLMADPHVGRRQ